MGSGSPTLEILGIYFPGWIVAAIVGVALAYLCVRWLGGRPSTRSLGQSGLLFVSLTLSYAMAVWWAFFSGF